MLVLTKVKKMMFVLFGFLENMKSSSVYRRGHRVHPPLSNYKSIIDFNAPFYYATIV